MFSSFEKLWLDAMLFHKSDREKQSKLRTYSKFKNKLMFKPYLDKIKNINKCTCFTIFRISAHDLKIEGGRYSWPKKDIVIFVIMMMRQKMKFTSVQM